METAESIADTLLSGGDFDGWRLPQGWTVEVVDGIKDCIFIGNDGDWRIWMSIDIAGRFFVPGYSRPRYVRGETERFSGVGWRFRMMEAAEEQLRSIS